MMPETQTPRRRRQLSYNKLRGMTLVELMVTVSVAGVLATLGSVSFREQVNKSHSVEAVAMLGTMRQAVSVAGIDGGSVDTDLNFTRTTFGNGNGKGNSGNGSNKDGGIDGDGNNGHGNNADGCDPDNPGNGGKCSGASTPSDSGNDGNGNSGNNGNGNGSNQGGGIDGDGNNGHGNNADGCDPDNPGNGGKCSGNEGDGSSTDDSGSGDDGSNGSSTDDSGSGDDGSNGSPTDDSGSGDDGSEGSSTDDSGSGDDGSSGAPGSTSNGIQSLCDSASPVPASLDTVRAKVYNAPSSAWASGTSSAGWSCLHVSRSGNQRYQFGYDKGAGNTPGADEGFSAWARGDLDGDGKTSLFRVRGDLVNGTVVHGAGVEIIDGTE